MHAQIPAYLLRFLESVKKETKVQFQASGAFQAAVGVLGATISAHRRICQFYACYTKSQFPMILIISISINANNEVVLLV